jgi:ArsR family transcriptional regulator
MKDLVSFGKLISDPTRLKIIKLLSIQSMCVCELMEVLQLNQPCISQHLTILKYHNLLNSHRDGKWIVYEINRKALG